MRRSPTRMWRRPVCAASRTSCATTASSPSADRRDRAGLPRCCASSPVVRPKSVVLRLHPRTDLRTLAPKHFNDAHAVILENLTEDHLDQLDDYEIDRLRDELADRWLGFTVAASVGLPAALTALVVDIGEPPPADEVFRQHFRAAQPSGRRRDALLDAADVQERIDAALRPPVRLGRRGRAGRLPRRLRGHGRGARRADWTRGSPSARTPSAYGGSRRYPACGRLAPRSRWPSSTGWRARPSRRRPTASSSGSPPHPRTRSATRPRTRSLPASR